MEPVIQNDPEIEAMAGDSKICRQSGGERFVTQMLWRPCVCLKSPMTKASYKKVHF